MAARNVFADFTALARRVGGINLGQGFPSFGAPRFVKEAAVEAIRTAGANQYTRPGGHPVLVESVARFYSPHFGRTLDPLTEVCSCNGAQEGLFLAISAFAQKGCVGRPALAQRCGGTAARHSSIHFGDLTLSRPPPPQPPVQ